MRKCSLGLCKNRAKLPQSTPNPCVLPQLGWFTINGYIDLLKLTFMWRILMLGMNTIYKSIVIKRLIYSEGSPPANSISPILCCINVAKKYDVYAILLKCIIEPTSLSLTEFKKLVKEKIKVHEMKQHLLSFGMYKNVELYRKVFSGATVWPWYIHASHYPDKGKLCRQLMLCIMEFDEDAKRYGLRNCLYHPHKKKCFRHIIFECEAICNERNVNMKLLQESIPQAMFKDLCSMALDEKCIFILCGFNGYLREHGEIYNAFLHFVKETYNCYNVKMQSL